MSTTKFYILISLAIGIIIFLVFYLFTNDIYTSGLISIGLSAFVLVTSIFDEFYGEKRHYTILQSKGFKKLISKGFNIEKVNKYVGLSGVYEGYIFDIYYDWSTIVHPKVYKAVIFNVYFNTPSLNSGKPDLEKLNKISKKHNISQWDFKSHKFWWRNGNIIMRNGVGIFNPSFEKLEKKMKIVVDILKKENLSPMSKEALTQLRKEYYLNNVPEIELYYKKDI